ncbi:hypothetical protein INT47_005501 [Mucor saturninus]|uniref:Origin recognition complex subunit 5 n=1 Tax=Mucor saturninus TaxID=64648 RepID=A0A8H7RDZ3_9FUNG|nr:hypothetical protein INT47_005501 [Mucor saturninus]
MYKHLEDRFPGREKQLEQLSNVTIGSSLTDYSPQSIFVYGPPSTGKTSVISEVFKTNGGYVNCVECFTPRLLFEHAMDQLIQRQPEFKNNYTRSRKIDNVQQFVKCIRETFQKDPKTKYLILDRAERLRDMPGTILPVLLRLSELTDMNICVVFISNIVFEKFRVKRGGIEPFLLRFPEYTREDTLKILQLDFKPATVEGVSLDAEFYLCFLEVIYSIFCHNCKDINELRYFAALLFPLYIKPIEEGTVLPNEKAKLFKYAQPYFAEATEKLYLREISSAEWSQETKDLDDTLGSFLSSKVGRAEFELPFYTRFLLIAAYLASYNPPRFDVRYFAKASEERSKKKGGGTRKGGRVDKLGGKMRQQLLGPKIFPVERMLAIFYSILDETLEDTIDIQLQITSLTTLRLLVRSTSIDRLDGAKYKCNVNFEFIKTVAKTVRFEIDKYLYDFC